MSFLNLNLGFAQVIGVEYHYFKNTCRYHSSHACSSVSNLVNFYVFTPHIVLLRVMGLKDDFDVITAKKRFTTEWCASNLS